MKLDLRRLDRRAKLELLVINASTGSSKSNSFVKLIVVGTTGALLVVCFVFCFLVDFLLDCAGLGEEEEDCWPSDFDEDCDAIASRIAWPTFSLA